MPDQAVEQAVASINALNDPTLHLGQYNRASCQLQHLHGPQNRQGNLKSRWRVFNRVLD